MATSARAQELAEQLLGLEATRTPLPSAEGRRFGSGADVKLFLKRNKKVVAIAAVSVGAIALWFGYKAWQKKKGEQSL
jgi:hypothetical protein